MIAWSNVFWTSSWVVVEVESNVTATSTPMLPLKKYNIFTLPKPDIWLKAKPNCNLWKMQDIKCDVRHYYMLPLMWVYYSPGQDGHGMVRYGTVWYGMVRYGMVRYGMVRYGMVRYGMVRYGMVRYSDCVKYGKFWILAFNSHGPLHFTLTSVWIWSCATFSNIFSHMCVMFLTCLTILAVMGTNRTIRAYWTKRWVVTTSSFQN